MNGTTIDSLRDFIAASRQFDRVEDIDHADWYEEIGALTEAAAELIPDPPMLLFDNIKGYPAGFRVLSLSIAAPKRVAIALGLPLDRTKLELVRLAVRKISAAGSIPPVEVETGPVMENVLTGDDIDMWKFPIPQYHEGDGGRYIGTGDTVLNRDPESGYVNMGTYRIQAHERDLLGLWMSPGQQGRQICQRYWDKGEAAPIAATFGGDPLAFMASHTKSKWGHSELDFAGGLRGRPLEVVPGPLTGLPISAHAEIAIEGEVPPPDVESRDEGPFGEWPGYYSGGTIGTGEQQPVIRVKAIYHRDDPIIMNESPLWPGAQKHGLPIGSGTLWDQMQSAGVQDVTGVYRHNRFWIAVSIKQRFLGHAKQAGLAVLASAEATRNGRWVIVVDDDIDVTDMKEVLWAMQTRVDPATDIEIIDGMLSSPLDPIMSPEKREKRDHTNSRAIVYATRPFLWKDQFPVSSRSSRESRDAVVEKYRDVLPFPQMMR